MGTNTHHSQYKTPLNMNKCKMPDFLQHCIRKCDGAASVLTWRPTQHCLVLSQQSQAVCVLGGRLQANARCVWLINTVQYTAVQCRWIYIFSVPPPSCSAAPKSDFPTIWCRILVLDSLSVCGVNIASAELPRTEITQLHCCHFPPKVTLHHAGMGGTTTAGRGQHGGLVP